MNKALFISIAYIIFVVLVTVCAHKSEAEELHPFAIIGLEYEFNEKDAMFYNGNTKSYSTNTDDLPTDRFMFQIGIETSNGYSFGYQHLSGATGGCPMNCGEAEYYRDSLFINYKFGGKP